MVGGVRPQRVGGSGGGHVLHRHHQFQIQVAVAGDVHDGHRARLPNVPFAFARRLRFFGGGAGGVPGGGLAGRGWGRGGAEDAPSYEFGHRRQGALGGGQADPLRRPLGQFLQTFQGQGQMRSPFGSGHRMDFVQDHPPHRTQNGPGGAGEQQVEGFGGGDEDVGRGASHPPPLVGRGVAGADGGRYLRQRSQPVPLGGAADAGQRGPQVAFHIVGQGFHRGDVEDPATAGGVRFRLGQQAVQGVEEGGQSFARPGGGVDEGVPAGGDDRPTPFLGGSGRGERLRKPGGCGGGEHFQSHARKRNRPP